MIRDLLNAHARCCPVCECTTEIHIRSRHQKLVMTYMEECEDGEEAFVEENFEELVCLLCTNCDHYWYQEQPPIKMEESRHPYTGIRMFTLEIDK